MNLTHALLPANRSRSPRLVPWFPLWFTVLAVSGLMSAPVLADVTIAGEGGASRAFAVQVVRNVPYYQGEGADERLHRLDLYLPQGQKDFPVLVFVHGGAWSRGDKNELGIYNALGRCFARHGIAVVCPNYRLSPHVKHPEHVRDIARAFAWTFRNIARYGGRPSELFIGGHSAGGHLAALLAADETYLKAEGLTLRNIRGALPISALFTIPAPPTMDVKAATILLINKTPLPAELGYALFSAVFGDDPRVRQLASPIAHVGAHLPPFLVLCGDKDLPFCDRPGAEAFCNALRAQKGCADFCEMSRRNHISILWHATSDTDRATQAMMSFILSQVVLDRLADEGAGGIDFLQQAIARYGSTAGRSSR
jgi:acetyl esterase/lipase